MNRPKQNPGFSRRQFLKISGATGAVLGGTGLGFFGYQAGRDPHAYTGCETFQGAAQTFDRGRFFVDYPTYEKTGPTSRTDARTEVIFSRFSALMHQWNEEKGLESLDALLQEYYKEHPDYLEEDLRCKTEIFCAMRQDSQKYGKKYLLAEAWSNAMGAVWPEGVHDPPDVSDFPGGDRNEPSTPFKMKSPENTAELIKQIAYQLGSVLVTAPGPSGLFSANVQGWDYDNASITAVPGCNFFAWPSTEARFGARVYGGADLDGDGRNELVVGAGPDPSVGSPVKVFKYNGAAVTEWFSLQAFASSYTHGTNVAAGRF